MADAKKTTTKAPAKKTEPEKPEPQAPSLFTQDQPISPSIKNEAKLADIWAPLRLVVNDEIALGRFTFEGSDFNLEKAVAFYRHTPTRSFIAVDTEGGFYEAAGAIEENKYNTIPREKALRGILPEVKPEPKSSSADLRTGSHVTADGHAVTEKIEENKTGMVESRSDKTDQILESPLDTAAKEIESQPDVVDAEIVSETKAARTEEPRPAAAMMRYEPPQLIALAIEKNLDIDKLRELMTLEREWRADKAKAEFAVAMARFGELKQVIQHNRKGKTAGNAPFTYSDFPATVRAITPWLTQCGLSFTHRQDPPVMAETKVSYVMVYCSIRHSAGHSEETPYPAIPDLRLEGKVSPSQLMQLAITYAKRQTLCMGLGLATAEDADDLDSQTGDEFITEQQVAELAEEIKNDGADLAKFLEKVMKVEKLEDILLSNYGAAKKALAETRELRQRLKQQGASDWKCSPGTRNGIEMFREQLRKNGWTDKMFQDHLFEQFPEPGITVQSLGEDRAQFYASSLAVKVNPK